MKARLRIEKKRAFSAVPDDILTDQRLGLDARCALAYMVGRPDGWDYYVTQIQRALGISEARWVRMRKELEGAGYYRQRKVRTAAGRIGWEIVVSDTPEEPDTAEVRSGNTAPGTTIPGKPMDGEPIHGQHGDITEEGKQRRETKERNTPIERAEGQRPSGKRARGPLSDKGGAGKYLTDTDTGISLQVGNEQDMKVMKEIVQHGKREIDAAVVQARAGEPSGRAYPSAVLRLLRRGQGGGGGAPAGTPAWARAGFGSPAQVHEIDITEEGETL